MPDPDARTMFAGFAFDAVPADDVVASMRARHSDASFVYAVTPNVDHAVRFDKLAGEDASAIQSAYREATWCLCDSRILSRLARMKDLDLPVVPGSTLTAQLFDAVIEAGDLIAIIGGDDATVPALQKCYPGIRFVQHIPPMGLRQNPVALASAASFIAQARARFTFIAVGSPQQELIARIARQRGDAAGIGLCIGVSIEFLTGKVPRAPVWMQRAGIEWSHRLLSDPRRLWRRYLVDGPKIFWIAFGKNG